MDAASLRRSWSHKPPSQQHISEVEAVADDMLARLDELSATLRTVSGVVFASRRASFSSERNYNLCAGHGGRADTAGSSRAGVPEHNCGPSKRLRLCGRSGGASPCDCGSETDCSVCWTDCSCASHAATAVWVSAVRWSDTQTTGSSCFKDALVNMRVAVQKMEATVTAAEANLWRCAH